MHAKCQWIYLNNRKVEIMQVKIVGFLTKEGFSYRNCNCLTLTTLK